MHGLVHIAANALDSYSGFKFENHLQKLKRLVRSPYQALQQVHNRVVELEKLPHQNAQVGFTQRREGTKHKISASAHEIVCYQSETAVYKLTRRNNCVKLKCGQLGLIKKFFKKDGHDCFSVKLFINKKIFFNLPSQSSFSGIHVVEKLDETVDRLISEIDSKV